NGYHGVQVNSGPDVTQTNTIHFTNNTYNANGSRPFKWGNSGSNLTWQQWRGLGHDTGGSFN
ncbi:MAG: hypothetical protein WAL25_07520, partial [Acidimicrobiia bacterium]